MLTKESKEMLENRHKELVNQKTKMIKQIKKLQKELEEVRVRNIKTFKIAGLEITEIQDWDKPYNEIVPPKGFRLLTVQEIFDIFESDYEEWLGEYKGKWNTFWCQQTKLDKLNERSRWVYLFRISNLDSGSDFLGGSIDDGRVIFCRK